MESIVQRSDIKRVRCRRSRHAALLLHRCARMASRTVSLRRVTQLYPTSDLMIQRHRWPRKERAGSLLRHVRLYTRRAQSHSRQQWRWWTSDSSLSLRPPYQGNRTGTNLSHEHVARPHLCRLQPILSLNCSIDLRRFVGTTRLCTPSNFRSRH